MGGLSKARGAKGGASADFTKELRDITGGSLWRLQSVDRVIPLAGGVFPTEYHFGTFRCDPLALLVGEVRKIIGFMPRLCASFRATLFARFHWE